MIKYTPSFKPGIVKAVVESVKTLNYTDAMKVIDIAKEQIGYEWKKQNL